MSTITESIRTESQTKQFGPRTYTEGGTHYRITATVRYDDQCKNGHNTFLITGEIKRQSSNDRWCEDSCGCIHSEIANHFPELAPLIKYHLCSSDGPLHYIANTVYLSSNKDCWGGVKGQPQWPKYYVRTNLGGLLVEWPDDDNKRPIILGPKIQNFKTREEAQSVADAHGDATVVEYVTAYHEGKEREFDHARSCAIWPEATDEQLSLPEDQLRKLLADRLPQLLAEFREAITSPPLNFTW